MQYYNRILTTIEKIKIGESYKDSPMVGVGGLEPPASWSRTKRATNCATPRQPFHYRRYRSRCQGKFPKPSRVYRRTGAHTLCRKGGVFPWHSESRPRGPARPPAAPPIRPASALRCRAAAPRPPRDPPDRSAVRHHRRRSAVCSSCWSAARC